MKPILETTADDLRGPVDCSGQAEDADLHAEMLHKALAEEGIHVAHTAINGRIAPGEQFEPDAIAHLLRQHHTDREGFQTLLGIR